MEEEEDERIKEGGWMKEEQRIIEEEKGENEVAEGIKEDGINKKK